MISIRKDADSPKVLDALFQEGFAHNKSLAIQAGMHCNSGTLGEIRCHVSRTGA